jgi:1-acyl-sn-glycerol-3-phosphate acyltransferase
MNKRKVLGAKDRIDRRSIVYHSIYAWVQTVFNQYYGKVEVHGVENIPRRSSVIFAPNHQNALMDALIVLFSSPEDTVFLARADLFRKPLLAKVLNHLKILPVFRIRDGVEELGKNQEIFDITVGVLHRKHQLCLMPEGNHGHQRRLRNLVKGIFRIALKAQEKEGNKPYVKIVPVGLDFSDYVKHHQKLLVQYGKPIEVSEYWEEFLENGPRGLNLLRKRLEEEMKPLMIHIETEAYYEAYMGLRDIFNKRMRGIMGIKGNRLIDKFRADKEMIARLDQVLETDEPKIKSLSDKVVPYLEGLRKMKIRDWVVAKKGYGFFRTLGNIIVLLATLPIALWGFINNALIYFLPVRAVRNIKDRQFHSSVKAGLAILIVVPLFYFVQTLLVGIFTGPWFIWVAYLALLYPTGKFALQWYIAAKKAIKGAGFRWKLFRKKKEAVGLVKLRTEIVTETESLIADR